VSRYKVDRSCKFVPGYKVGGGHWRSVGVQTISKVEICHGAGFKLLADARIRVQRPLRICLEFRCKSKNCDELINYTVRVMFRPCLLIVKVGTIYQSDMTNFIQLVCSLGLRVQVKGLIFL